MRGKQQECSEDACRMHCTSAAIYYNGADRVQHSRGFPPFLPLSFVCTPCGLAAGLLLLLIMMTALCVSRLSHNEQQWPLQNSPS
jgi:hypothetical protein